MTTAMVVFAPSAIADSVNGSGAGAHTSGSRTDSGGQASVSSGGQRVIPASGTRPHRGGGVASTRCTYQAVNAADPLGEMAPEGSPLVPGANAWRSCYDTSTGRRISGPELITVSAADPAAAMAALRASLVDSALANIDIDLPEPQISPPGTAFPNFDVWLGVRPTPPPRASASAAGVTVTVLAEPVRTTFDPRSAEPGGGEPSITCPGLPSGRDASCHHRFAAPTRDLTLETTVTWHLTWSGSDGSGGDLGTLDRTTSIPYRIQVKQTVIRYPS